MDDDPKEEARRKAQKRSYEERPAPGAAPAAPSAPPNTAIHDSRARLVGRRAQASPRPARLEEMDESELELLPSRSRHGQRRADDVARRAGKLRENRGGAGAAPRGNADELVPGEAVVVAISRGQCEVELGGETVLCHLPKALAQTQQSELAVGDRIRLARRPAGDLVLAQVLPRANRLSRPDPFLAHRERILAANLDLAVVVVALRKPPLSPGLVDRFLVALAHGGVPAAIAINKLDLALPDRAADPELAALAPYERLGVPIVGISTKTGEGVDALRALLAAKTAVFVGHSGVGKSSLLRALAPEFEVAVSAVSTLNDRGRHTTTRARIYTLDDGATRIVDTPGVREFGLWKMTAGELALYFDDFAPFAAGCRFSNCTHSHEPGCAVRDAAESGALAPARYETYLRIYESLDEE